jgi:predicted permease
MSREPLWRRYARLHGRDPRRDVDDEFAFHLGERVEELVARGVPPAAARAEALARFGDLAGARAAAAALGARRARRERWRAARESLAQDTRYALRAVRRAPRFAVTAVLTAALGIGANTVVFAVLHALLLRPLPVARPHELVRVYTSEARAGASTSSADALGGTSYPDYLDLRRAPALAALAAYMPVAANLRQGAADRRVEGRLVSGNFFATLGVRAALGRVLAPGDAGDEPAVVLDHRFWRTALGGDSAVVGRALLLNGRSVTVVGVAPPEFVGVELAAVDVYLPLAAQRVVSPGLDLLSGRGDRFLKLVGRLAPGATPARAARDLGAVMRTLAAEYPATNGGRTVTVHAARSQLAAESAGAALVPVAGLLFAVTGVVLVIAGVNVAGLLLARTIGRRRELAVRRALGAGRARVTRQLVTESVVLALLAEGVAVLTAFALPPIAHALGVPPSVRLQPDAAVLAFASAVTLVAGAAFGLAPALRGAADEVYGALRDGAADARRDGARGRRALVVAQVALSIVLLVVGGLLGRSLQRQRAVRPGFDARHLAVADFEGVAGFPTRAEARAFAAEMTRRSLTVPGVRALAVAAGAPLSGEGMRSTLEIPGYRPGPDEEMEIPATFAGPDYFRALGVPILRGAELTAAAAVADTLPRVVVNAAMARRYWPGRDPVGATVRLGGAGGAEARVIAVAADARLRSLAAPPVPHFVVQWARGGGGGSTVLVRTTGDAATALATLHGAFSAPAGPFVLRSLRSMDDVVATSLAAARALASTVAALSLVALALALVGLYGVVSYLAAQRTREFGVRLALGARPADVVRLVLGSGMRLAALGGAVGITLGAAAGALLRGALYSVAAVDALTLAGVAALVASVTVAACLLPALRATRASPAVARPSRRHHHGRNIRGRCAVGAAGARRSHRCRRARARRRHRRHRSP